MTTLAQMPPETTDRKIGGASASARALILRGDGFTARAIERYRALYPDHEIWSINATYIEGATRHFDVHYGQRERSILRACHRAAEAGAEVIESPWWSHLESAVPTQASALVKFPLDPIFQTFGSALYQRTLCFQLALAAFEVRTGRAHWDVICLPGHDFNRWPHYALRNGPDHWIGVCRALGLGVETHPESALGRRFMEPWSRPGEIAIYADHIAQLDQPHLYGHPRHITEPFATRYRW